MFWCTLSCRATVLICPWFLKIYQALSLWGCCASFSKCFVNTCVSKMVGVSIRCKLSWAFTRFFHQILRKRPEVHVMESGVAEAISTWGGLQCVNLLELHAILQWGRVVLPAQTILIRNHLLYCCRVRLQFLIIHVHAWLIPKDYSGGRCITYWQDLGFKVRMNCTICSGRILRWSLMERFSCAMMSESWRTTRLVSIVTMTSTFDHLLQELLPSTRKISFKLLICCSSIWLPPWRSSSWRTIVEN